MRQKNEISFSRMQKNIQFECFLVAESQRFTNDTDRAVDLQHYSAICVVQVVELTVSIYNVHIPHISKLNIVTNLLTFLRNPWISIFFELEWNKFNFGRFNIRNCTFSIPNTAIKHNFAIPACSVREYPFHVCRQTYNSKSNESVPYRFDTRFLTIAFDLLSNLFWIVWRICSNFRKLTLLW